MNENGVTVPSLETAFAHIRSELNDLFYEDLANKAQTPQGHLAGAIPVVEALIGVALFNLGNVNHPNTVTGTKHDRTYSMFDVVRRSATRSTVRATVSGVAGRVLPAGSCTKTIAGDKFSTIVDARLALAPGIMEDMKAVATASLPAEAGTLTEIVKVPGWETITNSEASVQGRDHHSDDVYRGTYKHRSVPPGPSNPVFSKCLRRNTSLKKFSPARKR